MRVALGTGQQTRTEALVGRGSSRPRGWRREGWEGFLGLVAAQLLLCSFFWNHHIFPCPCSPSNFLGLVNFSTLSRSSLFLKVSMRRPPLPLQSFLLSFHPFLSPLLPTLLPASLLWSCLPFFLSSPPYKRGAIVAVVFLQTHGLPHTRLPWRVIMV